MYIYIYDSQKEKPFLKIFRPGAFFSYLYKTLFIYIQYLLGISIIMSIIIVIVKGNPNCYHILILFTPQPCRYVN